MERMHPSRLDKLGIRLGGRVALVGPVAAADPTFTDELAERTSDVRLGDPAADTDVILLAADSTAGLSPLRRLADRLRPNGGIWVVSRKGRAATIRDVEVIAAAREAGLVDNKVVSFSTTHTALRLVIPLAARPPRERWPDAAPRRVRPRRPPN